MQASPVPVVSRTGDTTIDRNLDAIADAFRRLGKLLAPVVNVSTTFITPAGVLSMPADNVGPGLFQPGLSTIATVGGIIPRATRNNLAVVVDSGLVVNGMKTAGLISGTVFWLTFLNACKIKNGATVGVGEAPFYLQHNGAIMQDINWNAHTPQTGGRIAVQYIASETPQAPCFQLVAGPIA